MAGADALLFHDVAWSLMRLFKSRDAPERNRQQRNMHPRAAELIERLQLQPHPEGGYYRELYRSASEVAPADHRGTRASLTTIYFLLTDEAVSRWHEVSSDEVWHLYEGGPLELVDLDLDARSLDVRQLGGVDEYDGRPVHVIQAGRWQAARLLGPYALMGCAVAPGFEFQDFRLMSDDAAASSVVRDLWPELAKLI
jgi:predicted cupin superfamily sugar epimerase